MDMIKDLPVCYILTWIPYMDTIENLAVHQIPTFTFCVDMTENLAACKILTLNFLHEHDWAFGCLPNPPEAVFQNNRIQFIGIKHMFPDSA
jgi:hypothetical protein